MPSVERNLIPATRSTRRSQRFRVRLEAAALGADDGLAAPPELTIYDLSRDGFLTDARPGWSVGEALRIMLPDVGTADARIARAERDLLGCVFTTPLSPAELDRCRAASTVVWPDFVEPPGHAGRGTSRPPDPAYDRADPSTAGGEELERWPLRVRAAIAVGGGLLLWGMIALAVF